MIGLIFLISILAAAITGLAVQNTVAVLSQRGTAASALLESSKEAAEDKTLAGQIGKTAGGFTPRVLREIQYDLYWWRLMHGSVSDQTAAGILGLQILWAVGMALPAWIFTNSLPIVVIAAFTGCLQPRAALRTTANNARNRITQELPEFLHLMAAESASGAALNVVIERVAEGEGTMAAWMRRVIQSARGKKLIGDQGALLKAAQESGHSSLISMAIQLDFVAQGTQVQELLKSLATQLGEEYASHAEIRAEQLGNRLALFSTVFYFLPFILVLVLIMGIPMMTSFK